MSEEKKNQVTLLDQSLQIREMTRQQFTVLREIIHPNAKSEKSVLMAFDYCKARGLDPFKKVVHVVPVWSSKANDGEGGYIETIWPGISELRTTAMRTGEYVGCDETVFGPEVTKKFVGKVKEGYKKEAKWVEKEVEVTFPAWAQVTVYRMVKDQVRKFVGPKVLWLEEYATQGASGLPNQMWQDRPTGQIEKCAEAAALRKAFPEEAPSASAEEMEGKKLYDEDDSMVVDASTVTLSEAAEPPSKTTNGGRATKPKPEKEAAKEPAKEQPKAEEKSPAKQEEPPKQDAVPDVDIEDAQEAGDDGEGWFNN